MCKCNLALKLCQMMGFNGFPSVQKPDEVLPVFGVFGFCLERVVFFGIGHVIRKYHRFSHLLVNKISKLLDPPSMCTKNQ